LFLEGGHSLAMPSIMLSNDGNAHQENGDWFQYRMVINDAWLRFVVRIRPAESS
jgi:hypothetical protein